MVYSFGYNSYGQLGLGNYTSYNTPQEIKYLSDKYIIDVDCGWNFTIALSSMFNFKLRNRINLFFWKFF